MGPDLAKRKAVLVDHAGVRGSASRARRASRSCCLTCSGLVAFPIGLVALVTRYNAGASSDKPAGGGHMQPSPNIPAWKQLAAFWTDGDNTDPASASWD